MKFVGQGQACTKWWKEALLLVFYIRCWRVKILSAALGCCGTRLRLRVLWYFTTTWIKTTQALQSSSLSLYHHTDSPIWGSFSKLRMVLFQSKRAWSQNFSYYQKEKSIWFAYWRTWVWECAAVWKEQSPNLLYPKASKCDLSWRTFLMAISANGWMRGKRTASARITNSWTSRSEPMQTAEWMEIFSNGWTDAIFFEVECLGLNG